MRIAPARPTGLQTWPPLLATRGPGAKSEPHAHHAMHLVLCTSGGLRVRAGKAGRWIEAAGVLTAPDVLHAIDAAGAEILLVFIDPESDVGEALRPAVSGPVRAITAAERDAILAGGADPLALMQTGGAAWTAGAVAALGGRPLAPRPSIHPRVGKLLRHLRALPSDADTSLAALAATVGLSSGRLMHAFTASIGLPLRPYLAWLRLQRAAVAIVGGAPLADAAVAAGFSDSAHMTRTFRRMLGMPPSMLRQPVHSRRPDPGALQLDA
jgi:AraC-like DNA-binding protein